MRRRWGLAVAVTTAALLSACGQTAGPADDGSGGPTPASSAPMSPSDLPTIGTPTAPPTRPTDLMPAGVLAGRVTTLSTTCTEVTTDDAVVWSLSGDPDVAVAVGDTVTVKVVELDPGEEPCGSGVPARIVSLRVVE